MSTVNSYSDQKFDTDSRVRRNNDRKMVFWLTLIGITAIASSAFVVAYFIMDGRNSLGRPCRCLNMRAFKANNPKIDHQLWAYASFWSIDSRNLSPREGMIKFAPSSILDDLQRTFKRLSLNPTSQIPRRCNNIPWREYHDSFVLVEPKEMPASMNGTPGFVNSRPTLDQLFSADLKPEFQFHDDVMQKAEEIMKPLRDSEEFDKIIPIYLSGIPSDVELKLPNQSLESAVTTTDMLHSTMENYRRSGKPLFVVLGNSTVLPELPTVGNDTVWINAPDNVSLAILGSSNDTIFDHGLWPTFGALLARSNVNSYAMEKTLLDAARNASLNWTAAVTY